MRGSSLVGSAWPSSRAPQLRASTSGAYLGLNCCSLRFRVQGLGFRVLPSPHPSSLEANRVSAEGAVALANKASRPWRVEGAGLLEPEA